MSKKICDSENANFLNMLQNVFVLKLKIQFVKFFFN